MHSVSDCIIRIKNACASRRQDVVLPVTRMNKQICEVLMRQGFLVGYKKETVLGKKVFQAEIKRVRRVAAFTDVVLYSKPSLRIYVGLNDFKKVLRGKGSAIISTSKGVMTVEEAKKKGVGGELLFKVW
ncbi:MAG: 30S ribosomal protein S8 [Candidatus Levybacteria bacterium RIFCSPHIGHO2_02_FULL_42_12]|nr:MAG: 30S ribosomal protein S8 [Candidatus Levybacteria bacterium RIFCSPHIGHO2_01_FULL_42_15]OGH31424.1 MAG: 30S ribosomal protein S8 [Candidatus Levybacteria bacterium RIFCSPHIGHO2_02_FULL_42_12]OGH42688.1 MAG: 30S ribosomal protein S8 [Candidatus Levybacteria bacterium RIFCSPLOWO2_01_FULL_42_15]